MTGPRARDLKSRLPAAVARLRGQFRQRPNATSRIPPGAARRASRGFSRNAKARSKVRSTKTWAGPSIEIYASEIALVASELALTRKKLRSWTKPQRVPTSLVGQPGKSRIYHEPLGVVLIIGPWNYPLQLVLAPLVGAIAAGNCAIVKPSEVVPTISALAGRAAARIRRPRMRPGDRGGRRRDDRAPGASGSTTFSTPATAPSGASSWKRPPST